MDFDSNQTSVDNNCNYSLAKFVSQTVEETFAQFHKCVIGSISVALWQKQHVYRAVQPAHLPPHTRRADVLLPYNCKDDVHADTEENEPAKHTHTWNPRQSESELTCPQPGALHTKGLSSPIFAKALQCNCGREGENITEGFS